MLKYSVVFTPNFKRDYKLVQKRGYEMELLKEVIAKLANGEELMLYLTRTGIHSDLF